MTSKSNSTDFAPNSNNALIKVKQHFEHENRKVNLIPQAILPLTHLGKSSGEDGIVFEEDHLSWLVAFMTACLLGR